LETLRDEQGPLFEFVKGEVQLYRDGHSPGPSYGADWSESALARVVARGDNRRLTRFLEFVRGLSLCALEPKRFVTESTSEDPVLSVDGRNLASWYRHQIQVRPDRTQEVVHALKQVLGGFESMRVERVGAEARALMVAFGGVEERYELRLDELSDGQRALIALYSLLLLSGENDVLFIDEPDNYVALEEIQPWLIEVRDACGRAPGQVVLCSHHPELLDYFGGDAGVLLAREASGPITVRSLSESVGSQTESGLRISEIVARGWAA
jgi:predicted ATPase